MKDPFTPPPTNPSPSPRTTSTTSPSPPTASARCAPAAAAAAKAGWTCFTAMTKSASCTGTIVTRNLSTGLRCRGSIARSTRLSVVDGVRRLDRWGMCSLISRLRRRRLLRMPLRRKRFEDEVSWFKDIDRNRVGYCFYGVWFNDIRLFSILDCSYFSLSCLWSAVLGATLTATSPSRGSTSILGPTKFFLPSTIH